MLRRFSLLLLPLGLMACGTKGPLFLPPGKPGAATVVPPAAPPLGQPMPQPTGEPPPPDTSKPKTEP